MGLLTVAMNLSNAQTREEASITVAADLEYKSRNLFAGFSFSNGSVVQSTLTLGYGNFNFNAYTNYHIGNSELNEADLFADYNHQYNETISFYVGAGYYNFKNVKGIGEWDPTYEFYAGVSTSLPGNPSLYYARDFSLTKGGQIVSLLLSHEVPAGAVTVIGAGSIMYNDNYYRPGSNVSHYDLSLSIKAHLGRFTLTPSVTYQNAVADDFGNFWVGALNVHRDF